MASSNSDILLSIGGDVSPLIKEVDSFRQRVKPITIKFNNQPLGSISKDVDKFKDSLRAAELRTLAFASSASQLFVVQRAFSAITKATVETEKSLTDINVVLGLSQRQLLQFSSGLFKVANETGASFKTAADGAVELSRQGLTAQETLKRLKDALTLTRLSGLDVEKSINAITSAINSFNDTALDSTAIINKLANVDAQFAVSSGDIAEALTRVGSTAKDVGVSFDQLVGFVTSAKQITQRDGAVVGNALKTIFQRIQRPEVLDNLRELGVLTKDLSGKSLDAQTILIDLAKTYTTLSESQQNQVIQLSAGVYQANQFRAILGDLARENSIYSKALSASATASDQANRRQLELNQTLSASINETINNLVKASSRVGSLTLKPLFDKVFSGVNYFSNSIAGDFEKNGDDVGATIGTGILKGLGNYLSGPGLVLGGALILKLTGSFIKTASTGLASILESNNARVSQEQTIKELLSSQPALYQQILGLGNNQVQIQEKISAALLSSNTQLNEQLRIVAQISAITDNGVKANYGFGTSKPFIFGNGQIRRSNNASVGIIPAITESMGAYAGGYTPGDVKQLSIPKLGTVVYNTAEKVKQFPGLSQPAIIPPQNSKAGVNYKKDFINTHGFNPYKSGGYIPNYNLLPSVELGEFLGSGSFKNVFDIKSLKGSNLIPKDLVGVSAKNKDGFDDIKKLQLLNNLGIPFVPKFHGLGEISGSLPKGVNSKLLSLVEKVGIIDDDRFTNIFQRAGFNLDDDESYLHTKQAFAGTIKEQIQKFGISAYDAYEKGSNSPIAGDFRPGNLGFKDISVLGELSKGLRTSKNIGSSQPFKKTLFNLLQSGAFSLIDVGGIQIPQQKIPVNFTNKGLVPNYASPSDIYKRYLIEGNKGLLSYTLDKQANSANVNNIKGYDGKSGVGKELYPKLFEALKKEGIGTLTGALVNQERDASSDSPIDILKAMYPQLIRGRYASSNVISSPYNDIRLPILGGDKFDKDLKLKSKFLLNNQGFRDGIDLTSYVSNGLVPNYSALNNAIKRENAAGIPLSKIRVGQSSRISSSINPLGLGVYNTKDEPGGLIQGINRVASSGLNPKTAGVPNYAKPLEFESNLQGPASSREYIQNSFAQLQQAVSTGKNLEEALKELKGFNDEIKLTPKSLQYATQSLRKLSEQFDSNKPGTLKSAFDAANGRYQSGQLTQYRGAYPISPAYATALSVGAIDINKPYYQKQIGGNFPNFTVNPSNKGYQGGQIPFLSPKALLGQANVFHLPQVTPETNPDIFYGLTTKEKIEESQLFDPLAGQLSKQKEANYERQTQKELIEKQNNFSQKYQSIIKGIGNNDKFKFSDIKSFLKEAKNNYNSNDYGDILNQIRSSSTQAKNIKFTKDSEDFYGNLSLKSYLNPANLFNKNNDFNQKNNKYKNTQAGREYFQRFQNNALLTQLVAPAVFGVSEQSLLTYGGLQDSKTGRGVARSVGSLGNIASFAGLGATIPNPLGPAGGAVIGAGIGALSELPGILEKFSDITPDLEKKLEKVIEANQKASASFSTYIDSAEQLSNFHGSQLQYNKLQQVNLQSYNNLPLDTPGRKNIIDAIGSRNYGRAREINGINEFNRGLLETFKKDSLSLNQKPDKEENNKFKDAYNVEATGGVGPYGVSAKVTTNTAKYQKALSESNRGNTIRSELANIFNTEYLNENGSTSRTIDLFRNNKSFDGNNVDDITKNINENILTKLQGGGAKGVKDLIATFLENAKNNSLNPEETAKFIKSQGQQAIKDSDDSLRNFNLNNKAAAKDLDNLNDVLLKFSKRISDLNYSLESASLDRITDLTKSINKSEISFTRTKNLQLIDSPNNPSLQNKLNFQEETLGINNKSTLRTQEINDEFGKQIAKSIGDSYSKIIDDLNNQKTGQDAAVQEKISKRITAFTELFDKDKELNDLKTKLNSGQSLSDEEIADLGKKLEERAKNAAAFSTSVYAAENVLKDYKSSDKTLTLSQFYDKNRVKNGGTEGRYSLDPATESYFTSGKYTPDQISAEVSARSERANQSLILAQGFKDSVDSRNLKLKQNTNDTSIYTQSGKLNYARKQDEINRQFSKDLDVSSFESKINIQNTKNARRYDIQRLGANPLESNQIDANQQINEFNNRKFQELKASGFNGINNLNDFNGQITDLKFKKGVTELSDNSLSAEDDGRLKQLLKVQEDIKNNINETNEKTKSRNELDTISLTLAEKRLSVLEQANRNKAANNEKIDYISTGLEGFRQTSADFRSEMAKNVQSFSTDFKQAFKDGFDEAIRNGKGLKKALEDSLVGWAKGVAIKNVNLAIDSIFGLIGDGLSKTLGSKSQTGNNESSILTNILGSVFSSGKSSGGIIKYASGGFVNMGSGVKDDVPALLSGGEYVIKKSSVNKIGRNNLDRLNNSIGKYANGGNVSFNLKNEFETFGDKDRPTDGQFNIDTNLSSIALTDENNPQNALKFAREKYTIEKRQYDAQNRQTLRKYELSQKQNAYIAFGSALFNAGLQGYANKKEPSPQSNGEFDNTINPDFTGYGTVASNSVAPAYRKALDIGYKQVKAGGGVIKRYADGGIFGAESNSDKYPAMLMGGEYVIKKSVVDKHGSQFFDNLNKTGRTKGYANGGYVGDFKSTSSIDSSDVTKYLTQLVSISEQIRDNSSKANVTSTSSNQNQSNGINIQVYTTVNLDNGKVTSQNTEVKSDNKDNQDKNSFNQEDAKKLSESINAQIKQTLVRESTNGGILYERFKTRS